MKYKDLVKIKNEKPEYLEIGLKNEKMAGAIVSEERKDGKWEVAFLDNSGLKFYGWLPEEDLEVWKNPNTENKVSYNGKPVNTYDYVEILNDKYKKDGIKKGMRGVIVERYENGGFEVDFAFTEKIFQSFPFDGKDLKIIKKE